MTASAVSLKAKVTPLLQQTFDAAGHATAGLLVQQLRAAWQTTTGHHNGGGVAHNVYVNGQLHSEHGSQNAAYKEGIKLRRAGKLNVYIFPKGSKFAPRLAAKLGFAFNPDAPDVKAWAEQHAADLVTGVSASTRDAIRDEVVDLFDGDRSVAEMTDRLTGLLGDDARAEMIASTETMRAANEGQQEAWSQAIDAGLLTGDEQQEWIASDDEDECDDCDALDGETVGLDDAFSDGSDGPPAHPNCRCTVGLVMPQDLRDAWQTTTGHHGYQERAQREKASQDRAQRAKASHVPMTRAKQLVAREHELAVAKAVGGTHVGGLAPMDIHFEHNGQKAAIEVKAIVNGKRDKITMHKSSRERKLKFGKKTGRALHTVGVDARGAKPIYYHRAGVGSFRLHGMDKVSLKGLHSKVRES